MEHSTAYQIGHTVGVLTFFGLALGSIVFFVFALVKAINTRKAGWIIAASVSGLPFLCFLIFFLVTFAVGFSKGISHGISHANEIAAANRGEPSDLLTATMTPLTGNSISYEISLPGASEWSKNGNRPPYDYVFNYRDAYLGAIVEGGGLETSQRVCDLAQKNLSAKASEFSFTTPTPIQIDSRSWLTYDATATVKGINIKYRFYVYADANNTIQLISWTIPLHFERYEAIFDRIAKTFKLPK